MMNEYIFYLAQYYKIIKRKMMKQKFLAGKLAKSLECQRVFQLSFSRARLITTAPS